MEQERMRQVCPCLDGKPGRYWASARHRILESKELIACPCRSRCTINAALVRSYTIRLNLEIEPIQCAWRGGFRVRNTPASRYPLPINSGVLEKLRCRREKLKPPGKCMGNGRRRRFGGENIELIRGLSQTLRFI